MLPDDSRTRAALDGLAALHAPLAPAPLPSEARVVEFATHLRSLLLPATCAASADRRELAARVAAALEALAGSAYAACGRTPDAEAVVRFLEELPRIAARLAGDVRAAFEGDPAAQSELEIVACYPGIRALVVHRVAHALDRLGVPLLPRMLAEHAHRETGIDIHPSATIGDALFIDHGTGVVIGQTAVIGDRCRIYQGVTLGAKSFERESDGSMRRNYRRHPTLEDDVTVYAGATILGGDTVIGRGSVIAGSVFLTKSVPPGHVVTGPRLELRMLSMGGAI